MDAIQIIQTILPLAIALPFTLLGVYGFKGLIRQKIEDVLTPIYLGIAGFAWITLGVLNIYAVTDLYEYMAGYNYLFIGIGIIILILMVASLLLDIRIAVKLDAEKEEMEEMRLN